MRLKIEWGTWSGVPVMRRRFFVEKFFSATWSDDCGFFKRWAYTPTRMNTKYRRNEWAMSWCVCVCEVSDLPHPLPNTSTYTYWDGYCLKMKKRVLQSLRSNMRSRIHHSPLSIMPRKKGRRWRHLWGSSHMWWGEHRTWRHPRLSHVCSLFCSLLLFCRHSSHKSELPVNKKKTGSGDAIFANQDPRRKKRRPHEIWHSRYRRWRSYQAPTSQTHSPNWRALREGRPLTWRQARGEEKEAEVRINKRKGEEGREGGREGT